MKILLITQWYLPIKAAAAKRTGKMAKFLSAMGHKVTVITSFPSYPTGIVPQKYRGKLWVREKEQSVDVLRVYEYPTPSQGIVKRLLNMVSFVFSAALAATILPIYDAVIVSSPSFLSGLAGLAGAREKKAKFYFDIRDLWPDVTVDLGLIKPGLALNLMKKLEQHFYIRGEKIFVTTPGIRKHLFLEGIPLKKTEILLNSADISLFRPKKIARPAQFSSDDFIITYVGNHSRMYDLTNVARAAAILKDKSKIKFLLVGEGESKAGLKEMAQKMKLPNMIFWDEKLPTEIADILAWSNLGLISLNETKLAQETIPSKLAEYLAAGLPVVAAIGDEVKRLLEENQAGLIYEAGDPQALVKTILKLYKNASLRQKMGRNARKLALKTFSDKTFAKKLSQIF